LDFGQTTPLNFEKLFEINNFYNFMKSEYIFTEHELELVF
jgi:hypothetical protein